MNVKNSTQRGFTLIEVVMIIVILGILAAVAIPRFFNPIESEQTLATKDIANSLDAASAINYASCNATSNIDNPSHCIKITQCSDIAAIITPKLTLGPTGGAIESTYNLAVDNTVATNGTEATCILQYLQRGVTYTANYTVTGAGQ